MKIVSKILSILDTMKSDGNIKSYQYNVPSMANVQLSNLQVPTAVLYCVTDRTIDISKGSAKETANITIFFLTRQPNIGFDGQKNDALIDEQFDNAVVFLDALNDADGIAIGSDTIQVQSIFNMGDTNATGVRLTFDLTELQGTCL